MKDFDINLTKLVDQYISEEQYRLNLYTTIRENINNKTGTLSVRFHITIRYVDSTFVVEIMVSN